MRRAARCFRPESARLDLFSRLDIITLSKPGGCLFRKARLKGVLKSLESNVTSAQLEDADRRCREEATAHSRAPRKNLMLTASIESETLSAPVRVRNLSESGAMIDGAALPVVGAKVVLRRADLSTAATVMWREGGRCGIKFDNVVASVDEWVAGKQNPPGQAQYGQARVDAIQSAVRAGVELQPEAPSATGAGLSGKDLDARIAEEIDFLRRLIDNLGEELTDDPIVVQRHLQAVQTLDRASQILGHLGAVLSAPDRLATAQAISLQELRERLLRKAIF